MMRRRGRWWVEKEQRIVVGDEGLGVGRDGILVV